MSLWNCKKTSNIISVLDMKNMRNELRSAKITRIICCKLSLVMRWLPLFVNFPFVSHASVHSAPARWPYRWDTHTHTHTHLYLRARVGPTAKQLCVISSYRRRSKWFLYVICVQRACAPCIALPSRTLQCAAFCNAAPWTTTNWRSAVTTSYFMYPTACRCPARCSHCSLFTRPPSMTSSCYWYITVLDKLGL